ncbi:RluA family pseudouridine synthase [Candidatus Gottesmanbacteria bacterium]|nr:RluA family pseudouridine synthase [Candidatus Gottesmanbacteria bacterium]
MTIPILYEDDALLVINKPAGLVVNRAQSVKTETVQEWVEDYLKIRNPKSEIRNKYNIQNINVQNNFEFIQRAGIVHRIDKETSGILLIAKTPEAFIELQRQFKAREIKKTYLAIVHGKLVPEEGEINAPIDRLPWNPQRFGVMPGGKESVTRYKVSVVIPATELASRSLRRSGPGSREKKGWIPGQARNDMSLVELYPETGRTHQIRVHLKYINHSIVGDYLYAGRKTSRDDRAGDAPRVMLHAWKISFIHPGTRKLLAIESPIPDDMMNIINSKSEARNPKQIPSTKF